MTLTQNPIPPQSNTAFNDAFERVGKNAELLRQLRQATQDRLVTLATVKRFLDSTPSYKKLIILVDFDVLVAFVEGEAAADEDLPFIKHFFLQSALRYGFPPGAYRELLNYLRRENLLPEEITNALTKKEEIRNIPSVAHLVSLFVDGEEDFALRHKFLKIKKLLTVLTSDRYERDIQLPSKEAKNLMLERLLHQERFKVIRSGGKQVISVDSSRSNRDENDADNLGVAYQKMLEQAGREEWDEYLLLLTKTKVVEAVSSERRSRDGYWLSVLPELLFYADTSGCERHSRGKQDVRKAIDMLDDLASTLLKIESFGQNPAFEKEKDAAIKEASALVNGLKSLTAVILSGIIPEMEASFATVESTLRKVSAQAFEDSENQMSPSEFRLHYIKQMEYLVASLEGNPAITYSPKAVQESKWIIECSDKRYHDPSLLLTAAEKGLAAQWNVCATDTYFCSVVSKIFGRVEDAWSTESLQDAWCGEVLATSHEVFSEGIVWYTPLGVFGMRPGMVLKTTGWSVLRLKCLADFLDKDGKTWKAIFDERTPRIINSLQDLIAFSPDADQVSIITETRSILFDYRPNDNYKARRCSAFSKPRDCKWLAEAYFQLGLRFCQKDTLTQALLHIS